MAHPPRPNEEEPRTAIPRPRPRRALPIVLASLIGLLVGWLGIGWWLWPVEWTSSAPWQLRPELQRTYLALVAHEYARTSNLAYVEDLMAGWDRADLARLLAVVQQETGDPETRQHVAALAETLKLPGADTSLAASLLGQQGFVVGVVVAAVPLLAAMTLVTVGFARRRDESAREASSDEAAGLHLEELLADVVIEDESTVTEQSPDAPDVERRTASPSAEEQNKAEEATQDQAEEAEEAEGEEGGLGDLVGLFEIEDTTLSDLEAFCKGMLEVNVDELLTTAGEVLRDLDKVNRLRPERPSERSLRSREAGQVSVATKRNVA